MALKQDRKHHVIASSEMRYLTDDKARWPKPNTSHKSFVEFLEESDDNLKEKLKGTINQVT